MTRRAAVLYRFLQCTQPMHKRSRSSLGGGGHSCPGPHLKGACRCSAPDIKLCHAGAGAQAPGTLDHVGGLVMQRRLVSPRAPLAPAETHSSGLQHGAAS